IDMPEGDLNSLLWEFEEMASVASRDSAFYGDVYERPDFRKDVFSVKDMPKGLHPVWEKIFGRDILTKTLIKIGIFRVTGASIFACIETILFGYLMRGFVHAFVAGVGMESITGAVLSGIITSFLFAMSHKTVYRDISQPPLPATEEDRKALFGLGNVMSLALGLWIFNVSPVLSIFGLFAALSTHLIFLQGKKLLEIAEQKQGFYPVFMISSYVFRGTLLTGALTGSLFISGAYALNRGVGKAKAFVTGKDEEEAQSKAIKGKLMPAKEFKRKAPEVDIFPARPFFWKANKMELVIFDMCDWIYKRD
ncbi:unnamed protein product, partial [marine sediment metagenome]